MPDRRPEAVVRAFWDTLYANPPDFDAIAAHFTDDAFYEDVPTPDLGAHGPAAIAYRLKIGVESVPDRDHELVRMVVDGDVVVTEHRETWNFRTGETVTLPFVSVMEVRGPSICRWSDYSNIDTLLSGAPQWWLDHIFAQPWPPPT